MIHPRVRIAGLTLVLCALTLAVGITAAWRHAVASAPSLVTLRLEFTPSSIAVFVLALVLFTIIIVRFGRVARVSLSFFMVMALIAGSQFVASAWFAWPYDWLIAITIALLPRLIPRVIVHDLAMVVAIGGIGGLLGTSLTPSIAAILLAVMSIYDIISVYRTRHMVVLAGRMMESGAVFGFLVPARFSVFASSVPVALEQRAVMLLGSGDTGLPLVLAASVVSVSIGAAAMVAGSALVGVLVMQWLFTHQKRPAPMAALPPIAASALLGYVLAIVLHV